MIGTLVVTLPSSFRGGELTVEQHGEVMVFRGSARHCNWWPSMPTAATSPCGGARLPLRAMQELQGFLMSREQRVFEWPLSKEHRAHVHRTIEEYALPRHQTRRTGRPYMLVLTKRETMCGQEAARRKRWMDDLAWLKRR